MTHPNRTLMILAGIGLLIGSAVLVTVKTNIGWGQSGQDASSDNAGLHGPKISVRDDWEPRIDYTAELKRLQNPNLGHAEKAKRLVELLEKIQLDKQAGNFDDLDSTYYQHERYVDDIFGQLDIEEAIKWDLGCALAEWYEEDRNELVSFIGAISSESIRADTIGATITTMLGSEIDLVFEKAIELTKLQPIDYRVISEPHVMLYEWSAGHSPSKFRQVHEALKDWQFEHPDLYSGYEQLHDYGEDYPYGEMVRTLADINKTLSFDKGFPITSKGVFTKWAKYEPDAAYAWLLQGHYNYHIIDYINGYASSETASPQRIGKLVAEWEGRHESLEQRVESFYVALNRTDASEVIAAYFDELGVDAKRDAYLAEFLAGFNELDLPDPFDPFETSLVDACVSVVGAMSRESRMTYILDGGKIDYYGAEQTIALFKGLGHSDEDIKRLENHFSKAE